MPTQVTLCDPLQILGYTFPAEQVWETGETVISLHLYWRAIKPVSEDYTIFVQLLDSNNHFVTGFEGNYPTSHWQVGEVKVRKFSPRFVY